MMRGKRICDVDAITFLRMFRDRIKEDPELGEQARNIQKLINLYEREHGTMNEVVDGLYDATIGAMLS